MTSRQQERDGSMRWPLLVVVLSWLLPVAFARILAKSRFARWAGLAGTASAVVNRLTAMRGGYKGR